MKVVNQNKTLLKRKETERSLFSLKQVTYFSVPALA